MTKTNQMTQEERIIELEKKVEILCDTCIVITKAVLRHHEELTWEVKEEEPIKINSWDELYKHFNPPVSA